MKSSKSQQLLSYLVPQRIATYDSSYNGKIDVIQSFGNYYLSAGGLMQSGSFLERVWRVGLKKLHLTAQPMANALLLGLAGGSMVQVLTRLHPKVHITAVDIDPVIVQAGKDYLGLVESENFQIVISDAVQFINNTLATVTRYDFIFVDLYLGYRVAPFIESESFLNSLYQLLSPKGVLIFNRLYFQTYKSEAEIFLDKVTNLFQDVRKARSYSNLLIAIQK